VSALITFRMSMCEGIADSVKKGRLQHYLVAKELGSSNTVR
jgi:hypothetical protein